MGKQKRKYRVICVTKESAQDLKFEMEQDGKKKEVSVASYFHIKYKKQLQ